MRLHAPTRHRRLLAALLAGLLAMTQQAAEASGTRDRGALLEGIYESWAEAVEHLATSAEIESLQGFAFLVDADKETFISEFWARRDPWVMHRWRSNYEDARALYADPRDDRRRAVLVAGRPERIRRIEQCGAVVRELELWSYSGWHQQFQSGRKSVQVASEGFSLLFFRRGRDPVYRWWSSEQGIEALTLSGPRTEPWAAQALVEFARSQRCFGSVRFGAEDVSTARGREETIELLHGSSTGDASRDSREPRSAGGEQRIQMERRCWLEVEEIGEHQGRTVLQGRLEVPAEVVARNAAGGLWDRLIVSADVWRGDRLVDSFRVLYYLSGTAPGDSVDLDFYRVLRPGEYRLALRLEDSFGRGLLRVDHPLEVGVSAEKTEPPSYLSAGWTEATRDRVGRLLSFPSLELVAPEEGFAPGRFEVQAIAVGSPIARIEFRLDGEPLGADSEPPFAIELELPAVRRPQHLEARAFSVDGGVVAVDELWLDPSPDHFAVHLDVAPRMALIRVDLPTSFGLERVDVYLDGALIESRQEGRRFELAIPDITEAGVSSRGRLLRAVAISRTGEEVEDVVILDSIHPSERIDVRLVEMTVTVLDEDGRVVTDLAKEEVKLFVDGFERQILVFEPVATRPLDIAVVLDTSGSMRGRIRLASKSAERFVSSVVDAGDRVALLEFNHDIRVRAPFGSAVEHLRYAASGLRAAGTTRLNDSIVFTLHGFAGLDHRRAMVLLSDGRDVDSDLPFSAALEAALRARVAVFPIALDLDDEETSDHLVRLAETTGGSFFSIRSPSELGAVLARIEEELRSQYYVAFDSPTTGAVDGSFRSVRVETTRARHLEVRSINGYYR